MTQASFWQEQQHSPDYAELCNALYERELALLANMTLPSAQAVQGRLKSLSYYINRTALLMTQVDTPLELDVQNALWQTKQSNKIPLAGQTSEEVNAWYLSIPLSLGLIVPVFSQAHSQEHILLDCIDRVDNDNQRFRTNAAGWFYLTENKEAKGVKPRLLKPNKKVMLAACAGHCWQDGQKIRPIIPSLRELLLSCSINWKNFKKSSNR
mgnify:CR=1 FL=1